MTTYAGEGVAAAEGGEEANKGGGGKVQEEIDIKR